MEVPNQEIGDGRMPVPSAQAEAARLELIRTETVLSRLPVHNLAKQGKVNIQIVKTTPTGEVELKWEVSYSDRYGQARQLAYKLDTIVINQRIDEAGRPLPRLLRIGSLNEICAELNLATHAGQNTKDLRRAFLQNASAFITAKFNYRANDGTERHVEAGITRYGVIFTGEKLPDGRRADAVYIAFNDPFWEVLNNAPVRPLDRAYMKELPPAAQRFYEIISRKIFAALRNDYDRAKISYSEYCTYSAQLRHYERQRVQDQMAKVMRPHKAAGYIVGVKYEATVDDENRPDWIMSFTPGPKALAEYAAAHGRKPRRAVLTNGLEKTTREKQPPAIQRVATPIPQPTIDPQLLAEFTTRGITERKALDLIGKRKPNQDVVAQLELGDHIVKNAKIPIVNPPGFYVRLVESNTSVPDSFETNAKRKAREEREQKERDARLAEEAQQLLGWEYDDYCRALVDRYIDENEATFAAIKQTKWDANCARFQSFPDDMIDQMAIQDAKREVEKLVSLPTIDEFVKSKQDNSSLLKPVAVSEPVTLEPSIAEAPTAEPVVAELVSAELTPIVEQEVSAPGHAPTLIATDSVVELPPTTEMHDDKALSGPVIELASDEPHDALDDIDRGQMAA